MNAYPAMVSALSSVSTLQAHITANVTLDFTWIITVDLAQVTYVS